MFDNLRLWWFLLSDRDVQRDPTLRDLIRDRLYEGMAAAV